MMEQMPATTLDDWMAYFKVRAWEREKAERDAKRKR